MKVDTANIIAIAFGLLAVLRWGGDLLSALLGRINKNASKDGDKIQQLLSDFAVHKMEDKKDFESMERGQGRIEVRLESIDRAIVGLQHQMSFVASKANNRLIEFKGDET